MTDNQEPYAPARTELAGEGATEEDLSEAEAAVSGDGSACVPEASVLVVLLHPPGAAYLARNLADAWAPAVPKAKLSLLPVMESHDRASVSAEVAKRLAQAGLDSLRLVLAGLFGAEEVVLQLASGSDALACAGVLACGDVLPPLGLLRATPVQFRPRLRLVWNSDEPLFCAAALGDLLRWLRAAGLDAEGIVVKRGVALSEVGRSGFGPGPALVRMGGAYLAELVALALERSPRLVADTARYLEIGLQA
jgi:hypothetical protein